MTEQEQNTRLASIAAARAKRARQAEADTQAEALLAEHLDESNLAAVPQPSIDEWQGVQMALVIDSEGAASILCPPEASPHECLRLLTIALGEAAATLGAEQ